MKVLLRYLFGLSLIFGLVAAAGYGRSGIAWLSVASYPLLGLSVALLIAVFFFRSWMWWRLLRRAGVGLSYRQAVVSRFMPILGKYIPGKVWVVLGTAGSVSGQVGSLSRSLVLTLWFQLSMLISALMVAGMGLAVLGLPATIPSGYAVMVGGGAALAALLLMSNRRLAGAVLARLSRRHRDNTEVTVPGLAATHAAGMVQWLVTGLAFELLFQSLGNGTGLYAIFYQPAAQAGSMAIGLTPGGLGIREGITAGYLGLSGMVMGVAASLAVAARVWFFAVEVILFAIGWALNRQ